MPPPVPALVSGQVLPAFLLCSTLLIVKMYVVAVITGQVRLRKKVRAALGDPCPGRARFPFRCQGGFSARMRVSGAGGPGTSPSPEGWHLRGPGFQQSPHLPVLCVKRLTHCATS